ncbi:hypothetical protein [Domibacillus mangrovi]|uniref:Restriction endonuclease type IV Mrr domain-containing protein n=1 Tax=Domibacillus mangrovi TaxID=1714354 RepID=A0A1Q5P3I1_9BACI|nr:hypothetical protein [Domibacillus mangrovi]OKL36682.1 hypothetical protein BLL40_08060 [Domibacillus mangrovi]
MTKLNNDHLLGNIQKFSGEPCKLYNEKGEFVSKGQIKISMPFLDTMRRYQIHSPVKDDNQIDLIIKNLSYKQINRGNYTIRSIVGDDDSYLKVEIKNLELEKVSDKLTQRIDPSVSVITKVDKTAYDDFHKKLEALDWPNILIPPGCKGGDKATQADAFESMCQEIVLKWGAKNFGAIGKGTDRGRDATFLIEAHSWIPISTNYSNSWVLQCKYSNNYSNLSTKDIYEELVKVLMHKPDYFLLMTNRKVTNDFNDWLESLNGLDYYIPFKVVFIGKEELEEILSMPTMLSIREKYFNS